MNLSLTFLFTSITVLCIFLFFALTGLDADIMVILTPVIFFIYLFLIFFYILKNKLGENIFVEIGFLNVAFLLIYTIFPAFLIIGGMLLDDNPLTSLLPDNFEAGKHFWRHFILASGIVIGFLFFRGNTGIKIYKPIKNVNNHNLILLFCIFIIIFSNFMFLTFSAPVETYYENYTRFDHLPTPLRMLISIFIRLNWGLYSLIFLFLFLNYEKYKKVIPYIVIVLIALDIFISKGSRIQSLLTIVGIFCLYNIYVNKINFSKIILSGISIVFIFTLIAALRIDQGGIEALDFASFILNLSGELGSVYYTGFHLYEQRSLDILPYAPWQMFFYDFWAVTPFLDVTSWAPINWYHLNYFPDALVPPMTLGPIANSALWGGEFDLFFRGILCGMFYALMTRMFLSNRDNWIITAIYVFCFSTTIYIMKYSIFYHMQLIIKTLLPVIFLCWIITKINFSPSSNTKKVFKN